MSLLDAAQALDSLASGQLPRHERVLLGLNSLDPLLLHDSCEQALHDAASTLELFLVSDGVASEFMDARTRYGAMAAAVRRAIGHG